MLRRLPLSLFTLLVAMRSIIAWMLLLSPMSLAAASDALRRQVPLRDNWLIRQLDTASPDIAALTRDSALPDQSWLRAAMPAQVHEVLLANKLIPDPHVGRNAHLPHQFPLRRLAHRQLAAGRRLARLHHD